MKIQIECYGRHTDKSFVELVQPLSIAGKFQNYLDKNPACGVQHIAYSVPFSEFDRVISNFTEKGYSVNTDKEIDVMTEGLGITEEGEEQVKKMKAVAT